MTILLWPLYPFALFLNLLVGILPPRFGYGLAWLLGSLTYVMLPNRRRVLSHNYAPVMGKPADHPDVQRAAWESFRNYLRYLYEFLRLPHLSVDEIDQRVHLHTGEDFDQALALGKGAIFVSLHFGNADLTAVALTKHIVSITVVADMVPPPALMRRLVAMRRAKGVRLVYGKAAPRAVLESLKRNEAAGFLVDVGCGRHDGVPVTFFGQRTKFPAGPALLALRTGAPIICGYSVTEPGNIIEAYSYPPIQVTPTGDKAADVQECCQKMAVCFEDFLRRYPDQWYIYRPMWARGPAAGPCEAPGEATTQSEPLPEGAG